MIGSVNRDVLSGEAMEQMRESGQKRAEDRHMVRYGADELLISREKACLVLRCLDIREQMIDSRALGECPELCV